MPIDNEGNEYKHSVAFALIIDYNTIQIGLRRWMECFDDPEDDIPALTMINILDVDWNCPLVQSALGFTYDAFSVFAQQQINNPINTSLSDILEFYTYNNYGNIENNTERFATILIELLAVCIIPEEVGNYFHLPVVTEFNIGVKNITLVPTKGILFNVIVNW